MDEVPVWLLGAVAAPGVIAIVFSLFLWRGLARAREADRVLLPDGAKASLLDRQAGLQRTIERLDGELASLTALVEEQGQTTEQSLRTALRLQGLVRYDAYRDMGGRQSWSLALLDGDGTGAVVTSLHARDHARVYLKELTEGRPSQRLSPEEVRAVTLATGEPPLPPPPEAEEAPPEAEDDDDGDGDA